MTFPRHIFATLFVVFAACNAYAEQYQGLQLSTRDITTLSALKVKPEYVRVMRSYFPKLSAREIADLYVMKVNPEYLKETAEIFQNASVRDISDLSVMNVEPVYIQNMHTFFPNLSAREITNLHVMKVKPEYLRDMRVQFPNMSVRDVTDLWVMKVPPEYVKQIRDLGYSDISIREIIDFYVLKVKPDYIKQMREAGKPIQAGSIVPDFEVHVPKVKVNISSAPVVSAVPSFSSVDEIEYHRGISWFEIIVGTVSGIVLMMILRGYYVHRQRVDAANHRDMDDRITDFEGRVNDLQDILLSIDDRLDRRIHQS